MSKEKEKNLAQPLNNINNVLYNKHIDGYCGVYDIVNIRQRRKEVALGQKVNSPDGRTEREDGPMKSKGTAALLVLCYQR
jgi:hypothetical protein